MHRNTEIHFLPNLLFNARKLRFHKKHFKVIIASQKLVEHNSTFCNAVSGNQRRFSLSLKTKCKKCFLSFITSSTSQKLNFTVCLPWKSRYASGRKISTIQNPFVHFSLTAGFFVCKFCCFGITLLRERSRWGGLKSRLHI